MNVLPHDLLTNAKTNRLFRLLPRTPRIVDVGCGIRPCPVFPCEEHVCIEPHGEYVEVLKEWRPIDRCTKVVQAEVEALAEQPRQGTTVLLLDVIEHLERERGLRVKRLLEEFEHAVVFTPLGWYEQGDENPDGWGMNGGRWQAHRSAWLPDDFEGWCTYSWERWYRFKEKDAGAIMAFR